MNQEFESELIKIIEGDRWMIAVLKIVRDLRLNDCWIGAGFVRNKVWDEIHKKDRTKLNDIDIIYFDRSNTSRQNDYQLENKLKNLNPNLNWSVKNQARMHIRNGHEPYADSNEAISFWPETGTAIAVRLNFKNKIEYLSPYGLEDLFNVIAKPTPKFNLNIYHKRMEEKRWEANWNKLEIQTAAYNM